MNTFFSRALRLVVLSSSFMVPIFAVPYKVEARLFPSITSGSPTPDFGLSVKKHGDFVFVGAPVTYTTTAGAVYVYKNKGGNWVNTQILSGLPGSVLGALRIECQEDWL